MGPGRGAGSGRDAPDSQAPGSDVAPVEVDGSRAAQHDPAGQGAEPPLRDPMGVEPVVRLVRPDPKPEPALIPPLKSRDNIPPSEEGVVGKEAATPLTPRLLQLLSLVQERGRFTTQDHMTNSGVSHRTALRDLQALVQYGVVERVGARRGAFYRPSGRVADSSQPDSTSG